jgi:hypothetical protein
VVAVDGFVEEIGWARLALGSSGRGALRVPPARRGGPLGVADAAFVCFLTNLRGVDETKPLPPVFVDATGQRRRRLRRAGYVLGAASLVYTGLVGAGFSGGPVGPHALLPLPDLLDRPEAAPSTPAPPTSRPEASRSAAADTSVAVSQAVPVPTDAPLPASSPAARVVLATVAGLGPAVDRPIEQAEAGPGAADMAPSAPAEPTRPADAAPAASPEPAEPMAASPDPAPEPSTTAPPASTGEPAESATPGAPQASRDAAGESRRPSPRPAPSR